MRPASSVALQSARRKGKARLRCYNAAMSGESSLRLSVPTEPLSPGDRVFLLERARASIHAHLAGVALTDLVAHRQATVVRRGCFVSLHRHDGDLRGCV